MKEIPLTKGKVALVDDEDYEFLMQWKWFASVDKSNWYVARRSNGHTILMHRQIMDTPKGMSTDHIDGDGLNNQRANLRICTIAENARNRKTNVAKKVDSKYKGVYAASGLKPHHRMRWRARICINYKIIRLGYFKTEEEAALAYNEAAIRYHGEFAKLNKIEGLPQSSLPSGSEEGSPV